jgi:hypothetical protein
MSVNRVVARLELGETLTDTGMRSDRANKADLLKSL